jgi:hypothetical protein
MHFSPSKSAHPDLKDGLDETVRIVIRKIALTVEDEARFDNIDDNLDYQAVGDNIDDTADHSTVGNKDHTTLTKGNHLFQHIGFMLPCMYTCKMDRLFHLKYKLL